MIPDARLLGPAGTPTCDCTARSRAAGHVVQTLAFSCPQCAPLLVKLERQDCAYCGKAAPPGIARCSVCGRVVDADGFDEDWNPADDDDDPCFDDDD